MIVENLHNTLDDIKISSQYIEERLKEYKLVRIKERSDEVEWQTAFPIFVHSFYKFIVEKETLPTQQEYWDSYMSDNKLFFQNMFYTMDFWRCLQSRVFRAYPSFVRDIHFGLFLRDNKIFDDVFYNEKLDTEYGIDLVILKDDNKYGINLFTKTISAFQSRKIKENRNKKAVDFRCIDVPIDFDGCKICGDFFLYSEREVEKIKQILDKIQ